MKTASRKMEVGNGTTRSVLDCGGKQSVTPFSPAGRYLNRSQSSCARKLRRRFAPVFAVLRPGRLPEQSKTWRHPAASLVFLVVALTARAQSYSIDWSTIDGGGGTSTGGVFTVSGTIGQPDAGRMSGGNYSVDGGFWGMIAAVQTPGAPTLTIARTTTNTVAVTWPSPSTGWTLQQNTNSVSSVNWSNAPGTILDDGTNKTLIVNPPTGNRSYRLFKP